MRGWKTPPDGGVGALQARLPRPHRVRRGAGELAGALPASTILAEASQAAARRNRLPSPRNTPIDHFVILMMENRSFDHYFGWLSGEADAVQKQTYRAPDGTMVPTSHHSTLGTGGKEWKGCGHPDPGHGWDDGRAQLRGGFLDAKPATTCSRSRTSTRASSRRSTPRRQLHPVRSLPHLAAGPDVAQPLLQVVGPVGRNDQQQHPRRPRRATSGRRSSTAPCRAASAPATTTPTCPSRPCGERAARRGRNPIAATTPTAPRARCPTSRSSTRRSGTAAAATASRPTSTRSATCGSGRRSWPTSSTRSCARPTTSAARCSSSTTSGAGSSTTCARRACPTTAPAATWTRTSARWASGSPASRSRPTRAASASAAATASTTASSATSRSSS